MMGEVGKLVGNKRERERERGREKERDNGANSVAASIQKPVTLFSLSLPCNCSSLEMRKMKLTEKKERRGGHLCSYYDFSLSFFVSS